MADLDPYSATKYAEAVRAAAADAEASLLARTARQLAGGIDTNPRWVEVKLGQAAAFRRAIDQAVTEALDVLAGAAAAAVGDAADAAAVAAVEHASGVLAGVVELMDGDVPGGERLLILAREAAAPEAAAARVAVEGMNRGVLRHLDDVYRQVIAEVEGRVLLGAQTRRDVAQEALNRFAARGITGFTDRAGRRWDLTTYAEMATRTASQRAAVAAHGAALDRMGAELVVVSDAPQECELCRPWEGKVLALRGGPGRRLVENEITGDMVEVDVAGTVRQAESAGLFHPNCRHTYGLFVPGVTRLPTGTEDPEGDAARRRLRELERRVRRARRVEAAAMDDAARRDAGARVRAAQAAIRDHLSASPGLIRQPQRERLGSAR